MGGLATLVKYGTEIAGASIAQRSAGYGGYDHTSTLRTLPDAVKTLPGLVFYDLYTPGRKVNKVARSHLGAASSDFMVLMDIVDDHLDENPQIPLERRFEYMDDVFAMLFGYQSALKESSPVEPVAYQLAYKLREGITNKDLERVIESSFQKLVALVKSQFAVSDPNRAMEIAKDTGGYCTRICAESVGVLIGRQNERINQIAQHIGEYYGLADNAYEIEHDLKEGTNTYAALRVRNEGDSKEIRRDIRQTLENAASESFENAIRLTENKKEESIVRAIKLMMDLKYRVLGRLINQK